MVAPTTAPHPASETGPPSASPLAATPLWTELPLHLSLDRTCAVPLHLQLITQLREGITSGIPSAGVRLPGSRTLAAGLGVTRGVVTLALSELVAEGLLRPAPGVGLEVAAGASSPPPAASTARLPGWFVPPPPAPVDSPPDAAGIHFRPGVAAPHLLDLRAWRSCWQTATRQAPGGDYGHPAGEWALRAALAAFLGRSRGLKVPPERLLVTSGSLSALGLIAGLLPRGSRVLVENPGYRAARQVLLDAGHEVIPVPVDEDGLCTADLPPARLALVTPSHGYPLGVRLSVPRRLSLLAWARAHDALLVEDDYDGEFRYGAPPLPPLLALEQEGQGDGRVLYLGTLSKVLTPAVRTGYLVAPAPLLPALIRARTLSDAGHNLPTQLALTAFLRGGHLDRHIRRARRWHGQQQAALARALAPLTAGPALARLGGIEAGLHACLHLCAPLDAENISRELAAEGVYAGTLRPFTVGPEARQALVLGYGGLTVADIEAGARAIVRVVRAQHAACGPPLPPVG